MFSCKSKILFSIVIPVYNSGKYLKRCIESIQKQKFQNFEIILIEDKSTDSSYKICNFFLKKFNNIKLIKHSKRKGVSVSRNDGIKAAVGEYIIFIDSDDYLLNKTLKEIAVFVLKNNDNKLIFLNYFYTKLGKKLIKSENTFKNKKKKNNYLTSFLNKKDTPIECWRFIYKRNFLIEKNLFFIKKINFGEDQEFITKVLCSVDNLTIYNKAFYCFEVGSSNLRNKVGFDPSISLFKVVNQMCKLIKKNNFSILQKKFIKRKIFKPLSELKPQIMCLDKKQINKLSKFIKKNNSNFKILNNIYPKNHIYFFIKKYGENKGLLMFKSFISNKIKFLIKKAKFKKIYVFSFNIYSQGIIETLNSSDSQIKGIFDNNERINIKKILKLKIISPEKFFKKHKNKIFEIFIIICNQQKKDVKKIYNQLKKFGFKKNQIDHVNFYNLEKKFLK